MKYPYTDKNNKYIKKSTVALNGKYNGNIKVFFILTY